MFINNEHSNKKSDSKQVVVLGAGFGGVTTALRAAKLFPQSKIILISHNDYHLYHPCLYEVATARRVDGDAYLLKGTVALPLRQIVNKRKNITFKQAWVQGIDVDRNIITTDSGDISYDKLVIAMGSRTDFYDIPGLAENSLKLSGFEDAVMIRNHIEKVFDQHKITNQPEWLNFVIGGGGFTGVELAGELSNHLSHLRKQYSSRIPFIYLIEASNRLLSSVAFSASRRAKKRLESLGVRVILNSRITGVTPDGVYVNEDKKIAARSLIWTGGVKAVQIPFTKNVPVDEKGRVMVGQRLNIESYPDVFVVGDCSGFKDKAGQNVPATAQMAIHQARYVADNLFSSTRLRKVKTYTLPKKHYYLIPLSGKYALFVHNTFLLEGFIPYLLRRLADFRYFVSVIPLFTAISYWVKGSFVFIKND